MLKKTSTRNKVCIMENFIINNFIDIIQLDYHTFYIKVFI